MTLEFCVHFGYNANTSFSASTVDTVGWVVIRPVISLSRNDLNCVVWDVKPYSIQANTLYIFDIMVCQKC